MVTKFGAKIRELREHQHIFQRQLAAVMEIDTAMLSKIEKGVRKAKKEQVKNFARCLNADESDLLTLWLADQVYEIVKDEENVEEIFIATKAMKKN